MIMRTSSMSQSALLDGDDDSSEGRCPTCRSMLEIKTIYRWSRSRCNVCSESVAKMSCFKCNGACAPIDASIVRLLSARPPRFFFRRKNLNAANTECGLIAHTTCLLRPNFEEEGRELFNLIDAADVEGVKKLTHLRELVGKRFGADGLPPLIKCIEKFRLKPRNDLRELFNVLLDAADTEALNLTDVKAQVCVITIRRSRADRATLRTHIHTHKHTHTHTRSTHR